MKKTLSIAAAISALSGLTTSCTEEFSTFTIEKELSFALAEGREDSLYVKMEIEYPNSGISMETADAISDNITAVLMDIQYIEKTPQEAADAYIEAKVAEYRENNLPLLEAALSDNNTTAVLGWEDYSTGKIEGFHKNIISYKASKYTYTGGAHGMTVETGLNFDIKTGTLLKESDIFSDGYESIVSGLLTKHLPEAFENPEDANMLFQKEVTPNGNFTVSEKGITYTFNQYEIGPYALGIIGITIPWDEIDNIIKK